MSNKIGFAMCGSFCCFEPVFSQVKVLREEGHELVPIMSYHASSLSTRFGKAEDFIARFESLCGKPPITTIDGAEPLGPNQMIDILIVAPCTGNTIAKIAGGITDTSVTMAVKSHLRNGRPVLIAAATNDALGASAANIGRLKNMKNIYFVPMRQDDPENKPNSMVADFTLIPAAAQAALAGCQQNPMILG